MNFACSRQHWEQKSSRPVVGSSQFGHGKGGRHRAKTTEGNDSVGDGRAAPGISRSYVAGGQIFRDLMSVSACSRVGPVKTTELERARFTREGLRRAYGVETQREPAPRALYACFSLCARSSQPAPKQTSRVVAGKSHRADRNPRTVIQECNSHVASRTSRRTTPALIPRVRLMRRCRGESSGNVTKSRRSTSNRSASVASVGTVAITSPFSIPLR